MMVFTLELLYIFFYFGDFLSSSQAVFQKATELDPGNVKLHCEVLPQEPCTVEALPEFFWVRMMSKGTSCT